MSSLLKKAKLLSGASSKFEQDVVSIYFDEEEGTECLFYDCVEASLHPDAAPDGGILCTDKGVMERQKSAVVDIMKEMGRKLLTGKLDLLKISLPVKIFEARSYLQKLCDPLVFTNIMEKAAQAATPEERLRWVATYFVAGYHRAFLTWSKPFNPILGETWNAALPDGSRAYLEQISHHPPVSAYQIIGPNKSYHFYGHAQPTVAYKMNGITAHAGGDRAIEFGDGGCLNFKRETRTAVSPAFTTHRPPPTAHHPPRSCYPLAVLFLTHARTYARIILRQARTSG